MLLSLGGRVKPDHGELGSTGSSIHLIIGQILRPSLKTRKALGL